MNVLRVTLPSLLLAFAAASSAADKACTKADAAAGAKAVERVNNWAQLYKSWQDYRHCDTGAVAEGYTDALLRLFVEWKDVGTLAESMKKDAEYAQWVHARLKSPEAKDDAATVFSRVKASCPSGMDAFCTEIADSVKPK
ncbi:MAG: hypothetical protein ACXWG1_01610 [Usitatibacter sp.]